MDKKKKELSPSHLLHALWTKAVGTEDYDKEQWKALEKIIYQYEKLRDLHLLIR